MDGSTRIRYELSFVFEDSFNELPDKQSKNMLTKLNNALIVAGFTINCAYGLYLTPITENMTAMMNVKTVLSENIPKLLLKHIKHVHAFRVDEWDDATELLTGHESRLLVPEY